VWCLARPVTKEDTIMSHRSILPALGLGFLLAVSAWGQHHVMTGNDYDDRSGGGDPNTPPGCAGVEAKITINASSTVFSPASVTVDPGQPVCWTWSGTAAQHTIKADDGSFTSGPPSDNGTFQRTFNTPGTYGYYCQVHGSLTGGMRGTVVVRGNSGGGGGEGPGTLTFGSTSYTVDEAAGALTVTVERMDGSDGTASVKFATGNGTAKVNKDFGRLKGSLSWGSGDQEPKTIQVPIKNDSSREGDETFAIFLSKATGAGLGTGSVTVTIHDDDSPSCGASTAPAELQAHGRSDSEIRLSWAGESIAASELRIERRQPGGAFQEIAAVPAGVESFVDSGLPGGTTFQYRLRAVGADGASAFSGIAAGATDGSTAPCDDTRNAVCLNGGRFEAMVEQQPGATEGRTRRLVLPEAPNAGLFSFSRSSELQLLVNVLDGCNVNGHYGLSFAAVTDLELTVKVRDTQTGRTWAYFKPAGSLPAPVRDLEAFASCP
jgi:plastocyanin